MNLHTVMTHRPRACLARATLAEVARATRGEDVGEIPVIDACRPPFGVITDRDIVVRRVAAGHDPLQARVRDCMTAPARVLGIDATLPDCADLMARQRVRIPVVDAISAWCGIVAMADLERADARALEAAVSSRVASPH